MKKCTVCQEEKSLEEFYRNKNSKDGRLQMCKTCRRKRDGLAWQNRSPEQRARCTIKQKEYREKNKKQIKEYQKQYRESNREKAREYSQAYYRKNKDRLNQRNKEDYISKKDYYNKLSRINYINHREKYLALASTWRENNKDKRREYENRRRAARNSQVFLVLDKEVLRLYNSPCFLCGATDDITVDHIIPLAMCGRHAVGNLLPLCRSCNSSKGTRLLSHVRYKGEGSGY